MAERILGEEGSRRRRRFRFLILPLLLCTAVALLLASSALAVHDQTFQLDGDVSTHAYTVPDATAQLLDWGANTCNVADSTPPSSCNPAVQGDLAHSLFNVMNTANGDPRPVTPATNCDQAAGCQDVVANTANVGSTKAFDAASFQRDFESGPGGALYSRSTTRVNADDTTYSTGSKDTLGIANGGWQCGHSQNVNNKVDINNAYVASYWTGGSSGVGDHILYAGVEKEKNNGSNNIGVWFLQGSASCSSTGPNINWSGSGHRNGDVLIVSAFSNGGGVSTVKQFTWRASTDPASPFFGDGGCIDSRPGHFTSASGDCNQEPTATGGDCKDPATPTGANDLLCATTNALASTGGAAGKPYQGTVSTPWLASDATLGIGNNQIVAPDFIEVGVNITKVFAQTGETAPSCFNTGVPDTRSAPSATATLFDYVINKIGGCSSSTVTTPQDGSGTGIPAAGLSIGANATVPVRDHAALTVQGFTGTFHGTMTFYLCGPLASNSTTNCNNTGGDTGGVQIGNPVTVNGSNGTASVNSSDPLGDANGNTLLTSVGRYCWRAVYSGDGDVPGSLDPDTTSTSTSECFKITPLTPTLTTAATCSATPCVIGSTLNDTASLTGTAKQPGTNGIGAATAFSAAGTIDATNQAAADSSITWTLYGPASDGTAQCTTTISGAPTPSSVTVSGDSPPAYGPVSYTTNHAGDRVGPYEFAAAYGGNSPNTSAATAVGCDALGLNGEQVTVIGSATSSSAQRWLPNDRVVLGSTAGTTLHGTLTVTLYKGTFGGTAANCTIGTGVAVTGQSYSTSVSTATNSFTYNTTNSTFVVGTNSDGTAGGTDGTYFWLIHYADNNLTSPNDRCETSTISHDDG